MSWRIGLLGAVFSLAAIVCSESASQPTQAAFPGGNGKIAFERNVTGDPFNANFEIFTISTDGSGLTRLTFTNGNDLSPSWSPDGKKIAYQCQLDICVMNADGTGQTRLTNVPLGGGDPTWSPDGTRIAFFSNRDVGGGNDIYAMDADGSNVTRITTDPLNDVDPAWSPDGTAIAFVRGPVAGSAQLWVTRYGIETRIADWAFNVRRPEWSPDGTKIAFHTGTCGPIFIVDLSGNSQGPPIDGYDVAWSPDGTAIAVVKPIDGCDLFSYQRDIFIEVTDGSNPVNVTNSPHASNLEPSWQPLRTATPASTPLPVGGVSLDVSGQQDGADGSGPSLWIAGVASVAGCFVLAGLLWRLRARN